MKKIYMIWEADWGNTGIFFENEKDAEDFCKLKNNKFDIDSNAHYIYSVKQMKFYNSMEDYKTSENESYEQELKNAIKGLQNSIKKIENNEYLFCVNVDGEYYQYFSLRLFEEVLNNFKENKYTISQPGHESYLFGYKCGDSRYLTKEDLPKVEEGYINRK